MRGRKRHRKKDAKKRGIWKLWVDVTPKRGMRDQQLADALAIFLDYRLRRDREKIAATLANNWAMLANTHPPVVNEKDPGLSTSQTQRVWEVFAK